MNNIGYFFQTTKSSTRHTHTHINGTYTNIHETRHTITGNASRDCLLLWRWEDEDDYYIGKCATLFMLDSLYTESHTHTYAYKTNTLDESQKPTTYERKKNKQLYLDLTTNTLEVLHFTHISATFDHTEMNKRVRIYRTSFLSKKKSTRWYYEYIVYVQYGNMCVYFLCACPSDARTESHNQIPRSNYQDN